MDPEVSLYPSAQDSTAICPTSSPVVFTIVFRTEGSPPHVIAANTSTQLTMVTRTSPQMNNSSEKTDGVELIKIKGTFNERTLARDVHI